MNRRTLLTLPAVLGAWAALGPLATLRRPRARSENTYTIEYEGHTFTGMRVVGAEQSEHGVTMIHLAGDFGVTGTIQTESLDLLEGIGEDAAAMMGPA